MNHIECLRKSYTWCIEHFRIAFLFHRSVRVTGFVFTFPHNPYAFILVNYQNVDAPVAFVFMVRNQMIKTRHFVENNPETSQFIFSLMESSNNFQFEHALESNEA